MLRRVQPQPPGHACITRNCGAPRCRDPAVQSTEYTCTLQTNRNPRRALRTGCHGAAALPVEPPPPTARARGPSVYRRSVRPMRCAGRLLRQSGSSRQLRLVYCKAHAVTPESPMCNAKSEQFSNVLRRIGDAVSPIHSGTVRTLRTPAHIQQS